MGENVRFRSFSDFHDFQGFSDYEKGWRLSKTLATFATFRTPATIATFRPSWVGRIAGFLAEKMGGKQPENRRKVRKCQKWEKYGVLEVVRGVYNI